MNLGTCFPQGWKNNRKALFPSNSHLQKREYECIYLFFGGLVGNGYSMQCLIGLASSSGAREQHHNLPKEDGLWPACSHNSKMHISWKVHKGIISWLCLGRRNVLVQFKANLWPHCSIMLDIILGTMGVCGMLRGGQERFHPSTWRYWLCLSGNESNMDLLLGTLFFWGFGFTKQWLFGLFQFFTSPKPCS